MSPDKDGFVLGVIPARFGSTRFPGKPLAPILGKPMIQWVYERARQAHRLDEVVIATDDERIYRAAAQFGANVAMTSPDHPSGTDRVWEAASQTTASVIVNIQGDEPGIEPEVIDAACAPVIAGEAPMATLAVVVVDPQRFTDANQVRVVTDRRGLALYFSRAPIPWGGWEQPGRFLAHLGLYAYSRSALHKLTSLPPSQLERAEKLEQLRALENGIAIRVVTVQRHSPAVDVPADIGRAERWLSDHGR